MSYRPGINKDRRKGTDSVGKIIQYVGLAGWSILLAAFWIVEKARPKVETFLDDKHDIHLSGNWNLELIRYLFYLMILGLCLSIVGFCINSMRMRRRTDTYRLSILFLGLVSIGTILFYLIAG